MQAQINEVVTSASGVLANPLLLALLAIAVVALTTGLAGRVAIIIEDFHSSRRHNAGS